MKFNRQKDRENDRSPPAELLVILARRVEGEQLQKQRSYKGYSILLFKNQKQHSSPLAFSLFDIGGSTLPLNFRNLSVY